MKINRLPVEYIIADGTIVYQAEIINISAGGICFIRTSILEKGDIIKLRFNLQEKKIVLTAKVVRIEGREAAVKFIDDEKQIERFVRYFNMELKAPGAKDRNNTLKDFTGNNQDKEKKDYLFDTDRD